jgi:hypothetical protein
MADTLTSAVRVNMSAVLQNVLNNSLGTAAANIELASVFTLTDGTTTDKADKVWASTGRTLSGTADETIDVYDFGSLDIGAGAGKDPLSGTLALAEIAFIIVVNRSTSTGTLTIGADGTTAAWNSPFNADDDAALTLKPGMIFLIGGGADPAFAVADTSNHLLKMASSANLTYDIYIIGRSA